MFVPFSETFDAHVVLRPVVETLETQVHVDIGEPGHRADQKRLLFFVVMRRGSTVVQSRDHGPSRSGRRKWQAGCTFKRDI